MSERLPVNEIDRIEGTEYIVEHCTVCGHRHRHGGVPTQLDVGETTVRIAHCRSPLTTVYQLKRTPATEVIDCDC